MDLRPQYIDLSTLYLSDEDRTYVYDQRPELPRDTKEGCVTCEGKRTYYFKGQEFECDCRAQLRLAKVYTLAGIGELFQRLDWDDYHGTKPPLRDVQEFLDGHKAMSRSGVGMVLRGENGTGKTLLVSLAAKELVKLGYDVFFTTFPNMIEMFTKGWGDLSERERFERRIVFSGFLVLDDVGKEFRTKTNLAESTFDTVLRQRVMSLRPTILTTNMGQADMENGYGHSILSLLNERAVIIDCAGADYRSRARLRELDEIEKGWRRPIF